jgi:hypothetical protein
MKVDTFEWVASIIKFTHHVAAEEEIVEALGHNYAPETV